MFNIISEILAQMHEIEKRINRRPTEVFMGRHEWDLLRAQLYPCPGYWPTHGSTVPTGELMGLTLRVYPWVMGVHVEPREVHP